MHASVGVIGVAVLALAYPFRVRAQEFHPDIPRTWDENAVTDLELPLVSRERSPRYMTAEKYYELKVRPLYRSYPIYVRGKEPPGYIEWLKQREPEVIFDPSSLRTKEDWIKAGKIVFQAPIVYSPARLSPGGRDVPAAFAKWVSSDSVLPAPERATSSEKEVWWRRARRRVRRIAHPPDAGRQFHRGSPRVTMRTEF